jgi:hypothetical protein
LTAGEIAQHTGLTTSSVSSVMVEADEKRLTELAQILDSFQGTYDDLLDNYTNEQLEIITDYLTKSVEHSRIAIEKMSRSS